MENDPPSKDYVEIPLGDAAPPRSGTGIAGLSAAQKFVKMISTKVSSTEGIKTAGHMIKMKGKQWSAKTGLKGLRFMASNGKDGWKSIEKRFEELAVGGRLQKECFGKCIGER